MPTQSVMSCSHATKYVLLGAVVVVPIWLIFFLIGKARGKRPPSRS